MESTPPHSTIEYLRSPRAIRERCNALFDLGLAGDLDHFAVDLDRLGDVADRVVEVTKASYPDMNIPAHSRWGHFQAGGVDRLSRLREELSSLSAFERARSSIDLVVVSVLLDAGAGDVWRFHEFNTSSELSRSEGLAVASLEMFRAGLFSSEPDHPMSVDADALSRVKIEQLASAFQVRPDNPLAGLEGRLSLLHGLARALRSRPDLFASTPPRVGDFLDVWKDEFNSEKGLTAPRILEDVLDGLGPIWPGRIELSGVNLGDVWRHPKAEGSGQGRSLVPFHKLSQWLTYSLVEPVTELGWRVTGLNELTGLAEYRNGGLFLDLRVLRPKSHNVETTVHEPGSCVVVEWRALTVALLDRLAPEVRSRLGMTEEALPLRCVLEGGSWRAGRVVANELRSGGGPPIRIKSDGTVF